MKMFHSFLWRIDDATALCAHRFHRVSKAAGADERNNVITFNVLCAHAPQRARAHNGSVATKTFGPGRWWKLTTTTRPIDRRPTIDQNQLACTKTIFVNLIRFYGMNLIDIKEYFKQFDAAITCYDDCLSSMEKASLWCGDKFSIFSAALAPFSSAFRRWTAFAIRDYLCPMPIYKRDAARSSMTIAITYFELWMFAAIEAKSIFWSEENRKNEVKTNSCI